MKNQHFISLFLILIVFSCKEKSRQQSGDDSQEKGGLVICGAGTGAGIEYLNSLPTPKHYTGIGSSHLTITTPNKEAQRWFDQGLNHLHGFWHLEAYRAFKEVIKIDSNCAMGYCGLALCQPGFSTPNQVWEEAINHAVAKSTNTSPFEKALIRATEVLIKKGIAEAQTPFRTLYRSFPNEPEAISFAAIILRQDGNETTQQEVKKLLENALIRYPNNTALMHYYIHVMELRPEFETAINIAQKMVKIAPNAPCFTCRATYITWLVLTIKPPKRMSVP